jgi:aspartate/methionine/tyrosine aminotransferase
VFSDEVYEEHIFNGTKLARIGSLLPNRVLSAYSGGKLFTITGWRIGWMIANAEFVRCCGLPKFYTSSCTNIIAQAAIADIL